MGRRKMYPNQTGYYKVKSNNKTANWQDHDVARLQISMDNEIQTGEKLKNLVEWACGDRFERVEVIVSDTLNWFNVAFREQISETDAMKLALKSGEDWIAANPCLNDHPVIVRRWDEWFQHEEYEKRLNEITSIYNENNDFQHRVREVSDRIWSAKINEHLRKKSERLDEFYDTSEAYILSELSVFSIMFNERDAIEIYPGSWLKDIFEIITEYSNVYPYLECFRNKAYLHVEFVRNKAYQSEGVLQNEQQSYAQ